MLRFLRLNEVLYHSTDARTTHYQKIDEGVMTPPVKTGARSVAWPEHEIQKILAARLAGRTDDEIRELVRELIAARGDGQSQS